MSLFMTEMTHVPFAADLWALEVAILQWRLEDLIEFRPRYSPSSFSTDSVTSDEEPLPESSPQSFRVKKLERTKVPSLHIPIPSCAPLLSAGGDGVSAAPTLPKRGPGARRPRPSQARQHGSGIAAHQTGKWKKCPRRTW